MTKFFAERVINGKTPFEEVPTKLKESVAAYLIPEHSDLVPVEYGGTKED